MSEEFVKGIINQLPYNYGGIALDIGANIGNYSKYMASKFEKVYAFEPHPENIVMLQARINYNKKLMNNVEIVTKAVSDKNGTTKLYDNGFSEQHSISVLYPESGNWNYKKEQFIEVPSITIDDFCKNFTRLDFMKVDIEGAENFMFKGAIKTLTRFSPRIILECHKIVDYDALSDFFKNLGYKFINETFREAEKLEACCHFLLHKNDITINT